MKKRFAVVTAALLTLCFLRAPALALEASIDGTVVNIRPETINSPVGGTVGEATVAAGDRVQAGDSVATLTGEWVYALESGTVRLFGEVGDNAEDVGARYGAVAYIEPDAQYTVSASTQSAYDAEENKQIHPGETVYLRSTADTRSVGEGRVTTVSGTSFTVELTLGAFAGGETVYVYRSAEYANASRIGRGSVSRRDPVAYTGTGLIAAFAVPSGSHVEKGEALFATLEGSYAGKTENLEAITASKAGVIASVSVSAGAALTPGGAVAELYPDEGLRVEALVSEADLAAFAPGSAVRIEFPYLGDGERIVEGTVERVSQLGSENAAQADSEEAWFTVTVLPATAEGIAYGMHAIVSSASASPAPASPAPASPAPESPAPESPAPADLVPAEE